MKLYIYKFIGPADTKIIKACTRDDAIQQYSKETGCPEWFIKEHIRIVNLGGV